MTAEFSVEEPGARGSSDSVEDPRVSCCSNLSGEDARSETGGDGSSGGGSDGGSTGSVGGGG